MIAAATPLPNSNLIPTSYIANSAVEIAPNIMILGAISTAELAMYDVGIKFELGSGVAAAIKHLKV